MSIEDQLREVSDQRGVEIDGMLVITHLVLDALLNDIRTNAPRATATIEATEHVMHLVPHSLGHLRELAKALNKGA